MSWRDYAIAGCGDGVMAVLGVGVGVGDGGVSFFASHQKIEGGARWGMRSHQSGHSDDR